MPLFNWTEKSASILQQGGVIDPNGGWLAVAVAAVTPEDDTWGSITGLPAQTADA